MKKTAFFSVLLASFFLSKPLFPQSVELVYNGSKSYSLTERTDLRKYENGKYIGMTKREVHSFINTTDSYDKTPRYARDSWFDGNFYVVEERKNNSLNKIDGIYDSIPSVFHIAPNGELTMYEDHGFPSFRSFPAFPSRKVSVGDTWTAQAERAVDPKSDGNLTRLKIEVRYTLEGETVLDGQEVYKITALWQTLYGMSWKDAKGDPNLLKARGGHKANIMVLKKTGEPILVVDTVDETFVYRDKTEINYKGTISLFIKYPPRMDSDKIIAALSDIATVKKGGAKPMGGGSTGSITSTKANRDSKKKNADGSGDEKSADKDAGKTDDSPSAESKASSAKPGTDGSSPKTAGDSGTTGKDEENSAKNRHKKTGSGKDGREAQDEENAPVSVFGIDEENAAAMEIQFTAAKNDMIVEETSAGIRLTVQNVQFQADSAELMLGAEGNRLDEIARVLKMAGNSQILIEGHTASTGRPAGELSLSQERARKIANELVSRGIQKENIIVRGWGGTKPIAPNTNNAGKALNRRVEITILQ